MLSNNGKVCIESESNGYNERDYFLVTDGMQRESAIADDFWRYTFKHTQKNRMDVILENLERK